MLNKGSLNLCVRWGATSTVPATVSMNLTTTIARWFNDWFKALGSYGCFHWTSSEPAAHTYWLGAERYLFNGVNLAADFEHTNTPSFRARCS